jgi:cell surface protein SprA
LNPTKRWGGIMRPIEYSDFETSNVEFIEFWVMDPFINRPLDPGGSFYINLGNVSEDILKDGRKFFENGLPYPPNPAKVESTKWSKIPKFQQQLTPAFDNDVDARNVQDIGYDGCNDEKNKCNTLVTLQSWRLIFRPHPLLIYKQVPIPPTMIFIILEDLIMMEIKRQY